MSATTTFPTTLVNYSEKNTFTKKEDVKEFVTSLAKKVSHLFAKLLTAEGHKERSEKLAFMGHASKFPSNETVAQFEAKLTEEIVEKVLDNSRAMLATDYVPVTFLLNVLGKCDITGKTCSQFNKYFPWKTVAEIRLDSEAQTLEFSIYTRD